MRTSIKFTIKKEQYGYPILECLSYEGGNITENKSVQKTNTYRTTSTVYAPPTHTHTHTHEKGLIQNLVYRANILCYNKLNNLAKLDLLKKDFVSNTHPEKVMTVIDQEETSMQEKKNVVTTN